MSETTAVPETALAWTALAIAVSAGAFVQASVGFGFGLVATPVALAAIGSAEAIAVLIGAHVVQAVMICPRLLPDAPRRLLIVMVVGALVGMPLGLLVLDGLDIAALKRIVGISLLAFTAFLFWREISQQPASLTTDVGKTNAPDVATLSASGIAGLFAGSLTALLVMPGPPVAILGGWLRLPAERFRSLILSFMGVCYVASAALFAVNGRMTSSVMVTIVWLAPAVALATVAGLMLASYLSGRRHRFAVLALCTVSGLYALASSV